MKGWVLATVLLLASPGLLACPLRLGAGRPSTAQQLADLQHAVLAVPTADASRFRVIEVIKGERPSTSTIEGGYPRAGPAADAGMAKGAMLLLVRDDATYLRDPGRSTREIEAALLALSVHGNANGAIPRARVIESYRLFMQTHKPLAGLVAQDLAAWHYWDAVPEYVALMKSSVRQHYATRVAVLAYLKRSPDGAKALEKTLPETSSIR